LQAFLNLRLYEGGAVAYANSTVLGIEPIVLVLCKCKANARYYFSGGDFLRCADCDSLPEPAL
jgi:hypothetical protein